jgi:NitT/TauT family transport system substrate-binding protein
MPFRVAASLVILAASILLPQAATAEEIKIGLQKTSGNGPVYIALERGYFAAEGLEPKLLFFDAPVPVVVAVVSGDIDFGATGLSGALYSLAGRGALRLIAGTIHEVPTFRALTVVASQRAAAAGFTSLRDLADRSVAVSAIGAPSHYSLALIAAKYGIDLARIRILPLQSNTNTTSAVVGGQTDAAIVPLTFLTTAVQKKEVEVLGYVGEETPWQLSGVFVSAKMADERRDTVERYLRAFRKGAHEYYDAFTGADGKRRDGPTTEAITAMVAKYMGQSVEQVKQGVPFVDAEARLDVEDVLQQIAWYKAQGLLKGPVDGEAIIDRRYAVALPKH